MTAQTDLNIETIHFDTATFLGLPTVERIAKYARIGMTDHSYIPKVSDSRSDWVASVAVPAFQALASEDREARNFCSVGTGTGVDVLAAIEVLKASNIFITDLHDDVIDQAVANISANVRSGLLTGINSGVGDLLDPLLERNVRFDVFYENLPNIPIPDGQKICEGRTSSTFVADRLESVPDFVAQFLLSLHFLVLRQAAPLLRKGGCVLSSIGTRIPLQLLLRLAEKAGYIGRILIYTWKKQSEPTDVIGGFALWQAKGFGPFHFYPAELLEELFLHTPPAAAAAKALDIERSLAPYALSPNEALLAIRFGRSVGHTVAVLESRFR